MQSDLLLDNQETIASTASPSVREIALSAAWHGGMSHGLVTSDGRAIRVIHRGSWSHGFGPDFADAMLEVDGQQVLHGDVEIHLSGRDWYRHGHHLDPRYNRVVLHVVAQIDGEPARREDGFVVPTVLFQPGEATLFAIDQELPAIWNQLGSSVCAANLATSEPQRLRAAFQRLGDQRFAERVTRFAGDLEVESLSQVMMRGIFDAFGYSMNREAMGQLASVLIDSGAYGWWVSDPASFNEHRALAMLLGLGGYIPLGPADTHFAGIEPTEVTSIEREWHGPLEHLHHYRLPATLWVRARTRPSNHPAARLSALATLLVKSGADPTPLLLESIRNGDDGRLLIRSLTASDQRPDLGMARATAMVATVVLPLLMAFAQRHGDDDLEDTISRLWTELPRSEWSRPAKRALAQAAGDGMTGPFGERAIQGLLHLDRALCGPRRCFECPVAGEVIAAARRERQGSEPIPQSRPSMRSILPT